MWSMMRPGVPTTTCTPRRRGRSCTGYACPAVDREHVEAVEEGGVPLERFRHLDRELPRGREHESLWAEGAQVQASEQGQGERRGLPGPGLGLAEDVPPLQQPGDGAGLDLRGRLVAHSGEGPQERLREAQGLEVGWIAIAGGHARAHDTPVGPRAPSQALVGFTGTTLLRLPGQAEQELVVLEDLVPGPSGNREAQGGP